MRAQVMDIVLSVALASLLLASPAEPAQPRGSPAQEPSAREPSTRESSTREPTTQTPIDRGFAEALEVSLIELDVLVRDRDGRPIRGLEREDFRVLENGQERPIGGFSERSTRGRDPERDHARAKELGSPEHGLRDEGPSVLVVFLDHAALKPDRRARVLSSLERYLRTGERGLFGRSTRLALVTNDVPLEVRIPLTGLVEEFLDRLKRLPAPPASSARGELDRASASEAIGGDQGRSGSPIDLLDETCNTSRLRMIGEVAQYVDGVERRNSRTIRGLDALFTILGGLRGRKTVLYLGEGLELQPGLEMTQRAANVCPDLQGEMLSLAGRSIESELRALAADANAHRVTVYAFDAAGSRADELLDPELRQLRASNLQDSLNLLSRMTGGRLFRNIGDLRPALQQMEDDFEHSYSIAYVPGDLPAGALREVDVELVPAELSRARLVHRRAIRPVGTTDRLVAGLLAALWLEEQDDLLGLEVEPTDPQRSGTLGVAIRIPYSALVLDDVSLESLTVRLFMMGRSTERGARTPPKETFETITGAELLRARTSGSLELFVDMDLAPGRWDIAVGVRDERTSRTSIVLVEDVGVDGAGS